MGGPVAVFSEEIHSHLARFNVERGGKYLLEGLVDTQAELGGNCTDFPDRKMALRGFLFEVRQPFCGDEEQQAAAGLGVKQQHLQRFAQGRVKADLAPIIMFVVESSAWVGEGLSVLVAGLD